MHVKEDHRVEHRFDKLEDVATGELGGNVRVADVKAHPGEVDVEPAHQARDRAGVVAHALDPGIDRSEVFDRQPHAQSRGARQRAAQRQLFVAQPVAHRRVADGDPRPVIDDELRSGNARVGEGTVELAVVLVLSFRVRPESLHQPWPDGLP
ncbi:MAG TPA: hypothetical protein VG294_16020 [Solirubrobacteraceae bacterium]|nr:hypothetical protein [Solirubrobacteraceae bacterium]